MIEVAQNSHFNTTLGEEGRRCLKKVLSPSLTQIAISTPYVDFYLQRRRRRRRRRGGSMREDATTPPRPTFSWSNKRRQKPSKRRIKNVKEANANNLNRISSIPGDATSFLARVTAGCCLAVATTKLLSNHTASNGRLRCAARAWASRGGKKKSPPHLFLHRTCCR